MMAKDVVRTRQYMREFNLMQGKLQAMYIRIQTLRCTTSVALAMREVTKDMATMYRQLRLPQIQKIMVEFEEQSETMNMKEKTRDDNNYPIMKNVINDPVSDDEKTDAAVSQVLDELGLALTDLSWHVPRPYESSFLLPVRGFPNGVRTRRRERGVTVTSGRLEMRLSNVPGNSTVKYLLHGLWVVLLMFLSLLCIHVMGDRWRK
ncbi:charged multivesicular body protein 2a-like [Dendropsophus ebraccatus]|uniref:charged multivesicular body protein 2a-like n=1 Tax=Dendropsophus ebraccatus TaxID=150705 RepID=UPI0038323067